MITHLNANGEAIISADYADLMQAVAAIQSEYEQNKDAVSFTPFFFSTCDTDIPYRAKYIAMHSSNKGRFKITLDGQEFETKAPFSTAFGEENLIAVATAAHRLGLSKEAIIDGLSTASLPMQRFACTEYGDVCCIDDSYNANPLSCMRSITAAYAMTQSSETGEFPEKNKPLVCIMGEMLELGSITAEEHIQLGQQLAVANAIFWVGNQWEYILQGLENAGFTESIIPCKTPESFIEAYQALNLSEAIVLFKGSRSNKLEYFVEAFKLHMQNSMTIENSLHKSL